jgi:PPM family protein phosphatase
MTLILRYVARSDVGLVRDGNEDSGYAGPRLLAVADGMGGHAAGELASSVAIEELIAAENSRSDSADPLDALDSAVRSAHERIRELVTDDPGREGMGTTVTALLWTGTGFGLAHIGDSRGYRLRSGQLEQITSDHTFVQSLVDEGRITQDQASVHPARSMILRALQGDSDPQLDLEVLDVAPGDRYLLCSDGVTDVVSADTIRDAIAKEPDLSKAADNLVELALRGGGPDNVTLVLADVVETDSPPHPDDTVESYLVGAAAGDLPQPSGPRPGTATRSLTPRRDVTENGDGGDPEELRYAPRPPRRFRWLRRLGIVAVLGVLLWAGASLASDWIRSQYFVGEQSGEVAIFRGVSQDIGPMSLYRFHSTAQDLPVGALPELYRDQVVETIAADNLPEAEGIVEGLRREACSAHAPPAPLLNPTPEDTESGDEDADDEADTDGTTGEVESLPTAPPGYPGLSCPEDQ